MTCAGVLKNIGILSSLNDNELEYLISIMKYEEFQRDKVLFREGDKGDSMYIVAEGTIAISVNLSDGKRLEIAEISEGNFFGEMSIFDNAARSATCVTKTDAKILNLKAADFYEFIKIKPEAGIKIMHKMLNITTGRLRETGAFLSDMVTWGEQARTRAITDDFTGLYNRRFFDEIIEERVAEAKRGKKTLCVVMTDLDRFGELNNQYGQDTGDKVILAAAEVFRATFRESDILARYGGDEFTFLLPETEGEKAREICVKAVGEIRKIGILKDLGGTMKNVTASIGIACCPDHADTVKTITELADKALYMAKEAGRNTAVLWKNGA